MTGLINDLRWGLAFTLLELCLCVMPNDSLKKSFLVRFRGWSTEEDTGK